MTILMLMNFTIGFQKLTQKISIATVYRTVKLFEESGILTKHEFKEEKQDMKS